MIFNQANYFETLNHILHVTLEFFKTSFSIEVGGKLRNSIQVVATSFCA